MKIAVDLTQIRKLETGAERVAFASLEALISLRPDYEWLVYVEAGATPRLGVETDLARVDVRSVRHLDRLHRIFWQQTVLPDLLRREKVDLHYSPLYTIPLRSPCPSLLYVHDLIALERPDLCTVRNVLHFRALLGRSIRRAWRVIVPSRSVAGAIEKRFPRASAAIPVPPGITREFLTHPSSAELQATREALMLPDRFLLAVARIEPKKNYRAILDAVASIQRPDLADLGLVVVGTPGPDQRSLARILRSSEAAQRISTPSDVVPIRYLHALETRRLRDVYHLAECLLFPSLAEGYGVPPMEAMACGTPCIVSDRTPSYVEERGVDRWVLSEPTAECLARKIEELLPVREGKGPVEDRSSISDRISFESRVSWERHATSLARVIENRS